MNVYESHPVYGGPEEGGWYYDRAEQVCSVRFDNEADARACHLRMRSRSQAVNASRPPRSTRRHVLLETHAGRPWGQTRPSWD